MPVLFQSLIKRDDLRENPEVLYVFGDNDQRRGYGGLAAAVRGELNAVGVRTKKAPSMAPGSFYDESEWENHVRDMAEDLLPVEEHLKAGKVVVFPIAPLGSGMAKLKECAPTAYDRLQSMITELKVMYG